MYKTELRIEPLAPVCCAPLGEQPRLSTRDADEVASRLADAGLLHKTREGARVFYGLDLIAMRAISAVLDVCCDCCEPPGGYARP